MTQKTPHYHFIGIGGMGMSALAIFCLQKGYRVSGSDLQSSELTSKLTTMGAHITLGHDAKNLTDVDAVIYTSAMRKDNPEYQKALSQNIKIHHRAEFLAFLSKDYAELIAITGTHGKTTITSLLAHIMHEAELDPSFINGGLANNFTHHAHAGNSPYMIIEADESDASFLKIHPKHIIISNVDLDHMQTYQHEIKALIQSFADFALAADACGEILVGSDSDSAYQLIEKIKTQKSRTQHYGLKSDMDIQIAHFEQTKQHAKFDITTTDKSYKDFISTLPGKHNAENALAAIALCLKFGIAENTIKQALLSFKGIYRRFNHYQTTINNHTVELIDDYGHHPVEIQSTLDAVSQQFPHQRLIHIYQPHRYTRTRDLFHEFIGCLNSADIVILMRSYAASEDPIEGANALDLFNALTSKHPQCFYVDNNREAKTLIDKLATAHDVVLVQGAGDIAHLVSMLR
ncbi:UDP-N-acetylmuramate--L-alanine ligase [Cysteiniphilum sp. QT6929]|uniref:UDP-N-acetylmuramate--L-alanine ligase n=1 Tax=Cysteiniphilum sp. QT6929 TaxID=2975055 RepID=UPI0024B323C3|nr:UDP-N-acetylmuramate--L-alanine ligase [Cysteiniphilum sp. QT6929]WHN64926.1 UDP-N-acetylmuramate--L-alanine ligase [Cysteiniphilum sp. QT6929]